MRNQSPAFTSFADFASSPIPSAVRAAVAHFGPQGLTADTLHPLILDACRIEAMRLRKQTGDSAKKARHRAAALARDLKELGLERQIHVLYALGGCNGVNLGMVITGAMLGLDHDSIWLLVSIAGEPAAR